MRKSASNPRAAIAIIARQYARCMGYQQGERIGSHILIGALTKYLGERQAGPILQAAGIHNIAEILAILPSDKPADNLPPLRPDAHLLSLLQNELAKFWLHGRMSPVVRVEIANSNISKRPCGFHDKIVSETRMEPNCMAKVRRKKVVQPRWTKAELDALVAEAIVDAYGDDEQRIGLITMIESNLVVPFVTYLFDLRVTVARIEQGDDGSPVAVCEHKRFTQELPLLSLPLPNPSPPGWEWVEAYRHWSRYQ